MSGDVCTSAVANKSFMSFITSVFPAWTYISFKLIKGNAVPFGDIISSSLGVTGPTVRGRSYITSTSTAVKESASKYMINGGRDVGVFIVKFIGVVTPAAK